MIVRAEKLTRRAVTVRNAFLKRVAVLTGIPPPSDQDLASIGDQIGLAEALDWWISLGQPKRTRKIRRSIALVAIVVASMIIALLWIARQ